MFQRTSSSRRPAPRAALALLVALAAFWAGCADERLLGVNYVPEKLERDRGIPQRCIYYGVNRVLDFFDMFTVNAGIGPALHLEAHVTNGLRMGLGGAYLASVGTGEAPRQVGLFARGIGEVAVGPAQVGVAHYDPYLATQARYDESYGGLRKPSDQLYRKQRDYWAMGVSAGFLVVGGQFEFHPLQAFDFLAGWFFLDPLQDDK